MKVLVEPFGPRMVAALDAIPQPLVPAAATGSSAKQCQTPKPPTDRPRGPPPSAQRQCAACSQGTYHSFAISQRQRPDGSARAHCETSAAAVGTCAAVSAAPCVVRSGPTNPGSFDSCDKCLRNNQRKARRAGIGIAPLTPARRPTPNPYPRSPMRAHLTLAGPIAESAAHSPAAVARGASVQRSVKGLTPTAMLRRT